MTTVSSGGATTPRPRRMAARNGLAAFGDFDLGFKAGESIMRLIIGH